MEWRNMRVLVGLSGKRERSDGRSRERERSAVASVGSARRIRPRQHFGRSVAVLAGYSGQTRRGRVQRETEQRFKGD